MLQEESRTHELINPRVNDSIPAGDLEDMRNVVDLLIAFSAAELPTLAAGPEMHKDCRKTN